ncbi:MAG: hypothetical protein IPO21_09015 [Bacteroidales bacterium]|nr:hypothetical protein [Bacteroidales bacterium]
MKLAMPVFKETLNGNTGTLAKSFTETDVFCVYDATKNECNALVIQDLFVSYGKENLLQIFKELGITAVVSTKFMPMAMNFFRMNKINMFKPVDSDLHATIELFRTEQLQTFSQSDVSPSACSGSCSSCDTSSCTTGKEND